MTIEKLPSGNYRITEMRNGIRIRTSIDHKPTQREAKELIEKKINSYSNSTSFKAAAESYIKSKQNVLSPATIRGYYSLLNNMSDSFKNKPLDKLSLITDAMRAKGIPDGISELGGQVVYVKNGEARLEDGTLAGSVLRMNRAVQNMVEKVGVPFTQAVDYATINPARMLKIDNEAGSIEVGKRADFTVLNANYDVVLTIRGGKVIYQA